MTAERVSESGRSRLVVGRQIRRWRQERGLTLARVAERSGLTVGYLSQVENDKASPSLAVLGQLAEALDVSPAWFLMEDVPPPRVVRAAERPVTTVDGGRIEYVDGRTSRDVSILEVTTRPGGRVGAHAHPGDEHHVLLRGRMRLMQGDHTIEVGAGDYVRWDGSIPHDGEVLGDEEATLLIVRIRPPS